MRQLAATATAVLLTLAAGARSHAKSAPAPNELTPEEKKAGWRLLFDGKSTAGWRGFQKTEVSKERWTVEGGALKTLVPAKDEGGGDIITVDTFDDFDLRLEWRLAPGGNSGIKYLVTEERNGPIAHEFQLLDDERHPDAKNGPHRQCGSFYDVLPPEKDKTVCPIGQWNQSRVLVKGNHVEHWLNGQKILAYELGSPELKAAIAKSKFKDVPGFDQKLRGHILLQDHGDEVWFRSIKILSPPPTSGSTGR
jgi:hypothetical protein